MEIRLCRTLWLNEIASKTRTVTKTFQSNIIPHKGDYIFSTAFHRDEEVEVVQVIIDYEINSCMVYLEPLSLPTDDIDKLKELVDVYIAHAWDCPFYGFDKEESIEI